MKDKFKKSTDSLLGWLSSEVHLKAMRDALMMLIPFLAISGIATFFAYVLLSAGFVVNNFSAETIAAVQSFFVRIGNGCLGLMSLMLAVLIPYFLGRYKGFEKPIILSVTSLSLFFIFNPLDGGWTYFGTQGVLLAMIIGLTSASLFIRLSKIEKLKINIGDNVPAAVQDSFNSILIIIILICLYSLIATVLSSLTGLEAIALINEILQKPLIHISATLPGALIYVVILSLLFSVGIHPGAIVAPIEAAFMTAGTQGLIINYSFIATFVLMGGTGACLGLLVSLLFFAKRKEHKSLGKLAALSGIFNINEPLIFGLPIAYNPLMVVPFILVPCLNVILAYVATKFGMIAIYTNTVTWSTPIIVKSLIGTNGDLRNVLMEVICLVVDTVIWLFFLKKYEKQLNETDSVEDADAEK